MSIKQKLLTFPVVAILIFVVGMGITYRVSSKTSDLLTRSTTIHYPSMQRSAQLISELKGIQENLETAVAVNDQGSFDLAKEKAAAFLDIAKEMGKIPGHGEIAVEIQEIFNTYYMLAEETAAIMLGIRPGDVASSAQRMMPALQKLEETLNQAYQGASESFENSLDQTGKNVRNALWINSSVAFLIIAFLSIVGYALAKMIAGGIAKGVSLAQTVARGDLRQQMDVDTKDEIGVLGQSLNQMAGSLKEMVNKINASSGDIINATRSMDTETLSKGAEKQAELVVNISASISQMSESIYKVADAAEILSDATHNNSSSLLEMTTSIEEVAQNTSSLANIVEDVTSSVTEAVTSIKQVAENIDVVSSAAEETSAAVKEFSTSLKSVGENANEAAQLSEKVKKDASELGMTAIDKTINGMNMIVRSIETTDTITKKLGERSKQISKVLTVIDDVTEQTNLLSLNAAIIAAQAGEHGKGFGVVADAIKNLAERTAQSTSEITSMIEAIQKEVNNVLSSMQDVSENAVKGVTLSKEARHVLNGIVESSNRSSQMAWKIEGATKEQDKGVEQIEESVFQITEMIRQTADAMKQQEKSSKHIADATEEMKGIFNQVKQATVEQARGSRAITETVESVNQEIRSIAQATKTQREGGEQIVTAVEQIEEITQQNLSLASEVDKAIETLIEQAELLQEEVKRFAV